MKTLHYFGITLLIAFMSVTISSCSKNDDEKIDMKASTVEMQYFLDIRKGILNCIDITVEYYNGSGTTKENITKENDNWEKNIKTGLPVKLGYRIIMKLKTGVNVSELEKELSGTPLLLQNQFGYIYYVYNSAGRILSAENMDNGYYLIDKSLISKWASNPSNVYETSLILEFNSDGRKIITDEPTLKTGPF